MSELALSEPLITTRTADTASGLLGAYQVLLAHVAVTLIFTNVTGYVFDRVVAIPPYAWIAILAGLSVPLWFSGRTWRLVTASPIVAWELTYILVSALSYAWSPKSDIVVKEIRVRLIGAAIIPILLAIFSSPDAIRSARKTVVACVLLAVGFNCYEVFHPGMFSNTLGRSAGLYGNPNIAADALVLGLILSIDVVSSRLRSFYVIVVVVGIALTLSRAGILCGLLVLIYQVYTGTLRVRSVAINLVFAASIAVGAIILTGQSRQLYEVVQLATQSGIISRVADPDVAIQGGDPSTNIRAEVARAGWALFKDHPAIGAGVGSTVDWPYRASTHNIYLRLLAEFGIAGILFYPFAVYACIWNAAGQARKVGWAFILFLIPIGLFSHNVLDDWGILLAMSLMAAMAGTSRLSDNLAAAVFPQSA